MGKVRYFDNNQGVELNGDFSQYVNTALTPTTMDMVYDEATYGPIPDRLPYQLRFFVEDGVVEDILTGPMAGQFDYTAGTLTKVKAYDVDGNLLFHVLGLDLSMVYISAMVFYDSGWNAVNHILGQGHTFTGSDLAYESDPGRGNSINTGHGDDVVYAGAGNDWINDVGGRDVYRGQGGFDIVSYNSHRWALPADSQGINARLDRGYIVGTDGIRDKVVSIEGVAGTMFDDRMTGDGNDNEFHGLAGNDLIRGKGGRDEVRYGGDDWLGGVRGVKVDLGSGIARDEWGTRDRLVSIEDVRATDYDDVLRDSDKDNRLRGQDGDDKLYFGLGDDRGEGGGGADRFIFLGDVFGTDEIDDFEDGLDLIRIANAANFAALDIAQSGDHTEIQWNGNSVWLFDTLATDITEDDFVFL